MVEGRAADLDTQGSDITTLLKISLWKGDTWYLVDRHWFKQWKKYVGFDSWDKYQMGDQNVYPGPIDNSGLLKDGDAQSLKEHLIDELDYILLPTEGWNKLVSWYTLMEGQEPIARKVVEQDMFVKHYKVEVYLTELKLCENGNMNNVVTRRFSKVNTTDTIEKEIRKIFNIPDEKETRLWNKYMSNTFESLNKPDSTIQDAGLYQGQALVIEGPSSSTSPGASNFSTLPKISPSSLSNNYNNISDRNVKNSNYCLPSYTSGLCGLSNLGNTSFLNSAIQCLSNTTPLTEYFPNDKYQEELNFDNPLGMKGENAKSYAELIKQMWSGKFSYVTPRAFKTQVGHFAPQFSGYQQDCQELLAFLLDGLHEYLNRIRKKTYIQLKDADGRPDKVVVEEAWENHLKRNDSIICAKISVTFDLFCYLTLPLPMKKECTLEVYLVRMDPLAKPMQHKVIVPKIGNIVDLCAALSILSGVPADKMIVTGIYNHRFHRIFAVDDNLSSIMERDDIYVFEIGINGQKIQNMWLFLLAIREKFRHSSYTHHTGSSLFGQPFLMTVPQNNTEDKLYNLLLRRCQYIKISTETEETEGSLHCCKDQNINGNGPNGKQEEGSPSEMETDEPDDESSQDQELPSENENNTLMKMLLRILKKHESVEYKPPKKPFVKLKDCIELFTKEEKLGFEVPWYCPNCKAHQQATKKLDLWSLPPVLVVHLKQDKLDTLVDFPINDLDMSEFLINPNAGPCMGGVHYTSFAKNKNDGKWYYLDDSNVSTASEDQIVSKAAYVLFYQRQDTFSRTGFFPLDRETKDALAATVIPIQSDEDSNDNDNDNELENENCMHTN
uniref:Ubiquitin carboxyl-terminal hydrolase 15 n=1 Tax=Jaculus jaculus TaxID=51337 RepID=A0A8C5KP67_JACJA